VRHDERLAVEHTPFGRGVAIGLKQQGLRERRGSGQRAHTPRLRGLAMGCGAEQHGRGYCGVADHREKKTRTASPAPGSGRTTMSVLLSASTSAGMKPRPAPGWKDVSGFFSKTPS